MTIDIYKSRRGKFRKCTYWLATECRNAAKWALEHTPEGIFYAEETTAFSSQGDQINNTILIDKNNITLKTNDDISNITRGCVVEYLGHAWIVDNVQTEMIKKFTEFREDVVGITYVSIRR